MRSSLPAKTSILAIAILASACSATPFQFSVWNPVQLVPESSEIRGLRVNVVYGKNKSVHGMDVGLINATSGDGGGIGVGLQNQVYGNYSGVQVGLMGGPLGVRTAGEEVYTTDAFQAGNIVSGEFSGVQLSMANLVGSDVAGAQLGLTVSGTLGQLTGLQVGMLNMAAEGFRGIQLGWLVNWSAAFREDVRNWGLQVSLIMNQAEDDMVGSQISAINRISAGPTASTPARLAGIQIGLVNRVEELSGVQIGLLNFNKSGPLPFFPIVNFDFWD